MCVEIKITVKNEERKLVIEHLVYEPFNFTVDDPVLSPLVASTVEAFGDEPKDIYITSKMVIQ